MNIAVNTRLLLRGKLEGIGWFSFETLKRLTKNNPNHNFYFIFDRPYDNSFIFSENVTPIVVSPQARHPFLYYIWFELQIPKILKKINADVFLSPDGFLSLSTFVKQIPVIHDINFVHNPERLPFLTRKYYNYYFPKFARKAEHIISVSEFSKSDISKTFCVDSDKITVCYNAANSIYKPIKLSEKNIVKTKYTDDQDYFIFVGALNPRKNIPGLLRSFDLFKRSGDFPQKLVIVGSAMHLTDEIDECLQNIESRKDVIFTGRLENEVLHKLMASALALLYIPFFEGFGIPLVEAMACEIPIISSNTSSLPEVAGNAALYADPNDYETVAKYMIQLIKNSEIGDSLVENGKEQVKKFSWERSAKIMWDCIEKTVNNA